jgi:Calcineurin-like phosphoesterase
MQADRVGPGGLVALVLSPDSVSVPAGDSVRFRAMGRSQDGSEQSVPVNWTATGGQVSTTGLYRAGMTSGSFAVVATLPGGSLADTANVIIAPILAQVVLEPASATLETGRTLQFAPYGRMSNGDSVATPVTYAATGGTISSAGLYTAGQSVGQFQVIAADQSGTLADTSSVVITPTLTQVVIVPATASLDVDGTQQFTAYGRVGTGDSVAVSVTYVAAGGAITPNGLYTAGRTAGTFQVIATQHGGSLADTALVTITPTLRQILLVPDSIGLDVGESRQFSTFGRMSNDDSVAVSVTYTATGGGGTITPAGVFTAGRTAGTFQVIATAQDSVHTDTAKVTITPTLRQIVLAPDSIGLDVAGTQQFSTFGRMSNDDSVAVTVTYTATGGTITAAGLYTAGQAAGTFHVIAVEQGGQLTDTSIVTITPTLRRVLLVPDSIGLDVADTQRFSTHGRMSNNDSVAVPVTFSATGGTIDSSGLYTAGRTAGTFHVIAVERGGVLADTSPVTITPTLRQVILTPDSVGFDVGETQQFAAYGRLSNDDSVPVTVTYSATGGAITATGLYTAGQAAGTFHVIAVEQGGPLADTSIVTITPTLRQIILAPDSIGLDVDETRQFGTYGRMSNGDSVAVNVTFSATGGTIDATGAYTSGRTAGTYQVIAVEQGGVLADTAPVTITPTLRQVVLTPGAAGLDVGGTQQFSTVGRLSNGDSVAVSVTYSAAGGTISAAGLYTAGRTAGTYQVIALEQGGVFADTSSVTITPTLRQVILLPQSAGEDVGQTTQFTTYGLLSNDDSVAVSVTYSAQGGTISPGGLYTAGQAAGTFAVVAMEQGGVLSDTSLVTITPTLRQVVLAPASVTLDVGVTQPFTAYGRLSNNDSVAVNVTYTATGGSITAAGLYTSGQAAGTFEVVATEQGGVLADTSRVTITPTLRQVVLVPGSVGLDVGQTTQFKVYGRLSNGDSVAVNVTYTAAGGTITAGGMYTAGQKAGTFPVIATEQGGVLSDTSSVTITPTLRQVVLTPASVALDVGGTQQFRAYGRLSNNDSVAVNVTYAAAGGVITAAGLYTAGQAAGSFDVVATEQGGVLADTSRVTITPTLRQVILVPDTVTLIAATTKQFATYGRMSNGDSSAVSVTYTATGGTVTPEGLYTAGRTTGTFRIIARETSTGLRDTSRITIKAPTLAQVVLTPSAVTLVEATTQQFAAYGLMNNADSVAVSVDYSATGGTITAAGLYTAGHSAGNYRVIAKQHNGSFADTTTVTINPPTLVRVVLLPASVTLAKGASQQFSSYGTMDNGEDVTITVDYSATGGTISSSGLYKAGTSTGTYRVIATVHGGTLADTTSVTITSAKLAQVVLVPSSVTLLKGATQQFQSYGRMNTGDSVAVSVSYSATGGTISSSGRYTAGTSTGTFRVIAKQSGGTLADTSAVFIVSAASSVVFVGAGDIADCSSSGDEATAALLDNIAGSVFTLGDNAYSSGTPTEFSSCYDPTWGRHKSRTYPSPGNHDYNTSGAAGYFGYFGAAAGPSGRGYYSFDLGSWHIISLNSEVSMSAGSAQEQWLRADLAASTKQCTLAYWHKPRFSSGTSHGSLVDAQPLWQALYDYGAEIVMSGHDHEYERFAPQTPSGAPDAARGIREFVVGTGGRNHDAIGTPIQNSEASNDNTFGVLKLTLGSGTYSWQFVPVAGSSFTDSGSGTCH